MAKKQISNKDEKIHEEIFIEKKYSRSKDDIIKKASEARKKAWEQKQKKAKPENTREEFRKFFIRIKDKLNLEGEMEKVIWLHFTKTGFDKKEKFEKGIEHFGYKL